MSTIDGSQHRINERLKTYWEGLCAGRAMPLESDVSMDDLKDIWPHCFLVSVRNDKFSYNYLGPELIHAFGDDLTGKEIAETLLFPHPSSLISAFKKVVLYKKPEIDDSEFTNSRGAAVKYRSCVLPLGAHGNSSVAFLLGGMKWKAY